jgi:hypothetical protein
MDKAELKSKLTELEGMVISADEFGSDHHERKEMRVLFDEIKGDLLSLLNEESAVTNDNFCQCPQPHTISTTSGGTKCAICNGWIYKL